MQVLICIITPILIGIAVRLISSNIAKSNRKEILTSLRKEHIVIRLPKIYLWIGCLESVFCFTCISFMIFFPNRTEAAWTWILFVLFACIGVVIVLKTLFWKIDIFRNEKYFFVKSLPFRTHRIQYSDCVSYKLGDNSLVLKTDKKTFYIDIHATNFEFLLAMLTQNKVREIQ